MILLKDLLDNKKLYENSNSHEKLYTKEDLQQLADYIESAYDFISSGVMTQQELKEKLHDRWGLD